MKEKRLNQILVEKKGIFFINFIFFPNFSEQPRTNSRHQQGLEIWKVHLKKNDNDKSNKIKKRRLHQNLRSNEIIYFWRSFSDKNDHDTLNNVHEVSKLKDQLYSEDKVLFPWPRSSRLLGPRRFLSAQRLQAFFKNGTV